MIDTDKYEGHTEGKWDITMDDMMEGYYFFRQGYDREQEEDYDYGECNANAKLMSDAPLLLAEVKRLRERLSMWEDWFKQGAANKMQDGDAYDIIFHNHDTCLSECSNHCDYKCWICQTKELFE